MIGLDLVMAGYVQLVSGSIKCQLKKAPEISVVATDTNVKYDHSKSQAQLDNFQVDTINPYGEKIQTHVGGLMSGEIKTRQNIRISQEGYPGLNTACLMLDKVSVSIHIDPTIYIASHYKKTGCMYKAIMEHEKKHVALDRAIVNKYTNLIVNGLDVAMKKSGYVRGPIPMQQVKAYQEQMSGVANSVLKHYTSQMNEERRARQQQIDSIQEYNRVNNSCRGQR